MPTPTLVCDELEARCIGNLELVETLMSFFTHVGKLRLGRIKSVSVEPCAYDERDAWSNGSKFIKPMPAAANIATEWSSLPTPIGWTPPFWKPSLFLPGWRAGTVAGDISVDVSEVDFFEDVQ